MRFLDRLQPLGLLGLRVVLGVIMAGHGYRKFFAGGMPHHFDLVRHIGLPGWLAYVSAGAEFFGGLLLVMGLFTRLAALAVFIDMLVAVLKVHWSNGLMGPNGSEFPLSLMAMAFALIFLGAGAISLDHVLRGGGGGRRAASK